MPGATFLEGEWLELRTVKPEDYEFIHRYWNSPTVRYGAPMASPISEETIGGFVQKGDESVQFLPCQDGDPVGFVFLFDIDEMADHAEIGYWVTPDERGNGYATEAAELCLKHAFDDRGLHKVIAHAFTDNEASKRVLEKLGFQEEGRLREHRYLDGKHKDMLLYGLLKSEH